MVIYDQLNPAYSKYYKKPEAKSLLTESGFVDVQLHHYKEYSWSLIGRKPAKEDYTDRSVKRVVSH